MQNHIHSNVSNVSATDDLSSVAEALRTHETFDRAQVAWLMSQAMRWGYEQREAEENEAWPAADYFCAGELIRDLDRKAYRDRLDATARLPRPGDFKGRETDAPPLRVAA